MPLFFKKSLIKWSALAFLGVSAYFLGYFWAMKNLENEVKTRQTASTPSQEKSVEVKSDQATDLRKLK
jgi:hypothetical protein